MFGRSPQSHLLLLLDRIGFVAQDTPLYSSFTVADMLTFGRRLNSRWDQPPAEARVRRLNIPFDQRIGHLSGGQRSQVALALALGKRPELLLLDEPVARLDPLARREFMLYQYALVVFPALAGAFIGCPLVAREIENGTYRLAWTQGVTRTRWLLVKLAWVSISLLIAAAAVGYLEVILVNVMGTQPNHWAFFDQQAPITVAATLFALALGIATGAVVGRSVPAMAVTLVAFVVVRVGLAEIARPNYMAPVLYTTHDLSAFNPAANPTAWWMGQPNYYDAAGHVVSNGGPAGLSQLVSYVSQYFQPGDRFWTFQSIESGILVGLAALLLAFAYYWVTRRVS